VLILVPLTIIAANGSGSPFLVLMIPLIPPGGDPPGSACAKAAKEVTRTR